MTIISGGAAGLTGRKLIRSPSLELEEPVGYDDEGNPIFAQPVAPGPSLPAPCLRVLQIGKPEECRSDCPGRQPDASCLCDIIWAANEQGIKWAFEVDRRDGTWEYTGPSLEV